MSPKIVSHERDAKPLEIAATLRRDGAVIVRELLSHELVDQLVTAVAPHMHVPKGNDFYGGDVKTCSNLLDRDPIFSQELLLHPVVLDVLDVLDGTLLPDNPMGPSNASSQPKHGEDGFDQLTSMGERTRDPVNGPNCHHYHVHFSGSIHVGPGGGHQELHREMDIYRPYLDQDPDAPDWVVAVNYAGTDFTTKNGATRIVPGSHRWSKDREPHPHEEAQAEMPKGSALFWLGRSFHALGTNHTEENRAGLITIFSANWLAQEENQFISVPPDMAETLPEQAQQLLGYRASPVGWAADRDPENLLRPGTATYI